MPIKIEWLEDALREESATKNVMKLTELSSDPAVASGENYTSTIRRVQMDAVLGSGKQIKMSLIVKELPTEGSNMDFLESEAFFETEIKLYKDVLPHLEDVLREQGVPPLWPTFLGKKENYLIFSDLKMKNYTVSCRKTRLDLDHTLLAVRTLALFHAASVVLKHRGKLDVSGLEPTFLVRNTSAIRKFRAGAVLTAAKTILKDWGPKWTDIGHRLLVKAPRFAEDVEKFAVVDESRLNVLCHGDLWTTNMMFKYSKGLNLPIGVRFVDFQLAHYNSYGFDLQYFMGTSLPADIRRTCRLQILESYTNVLEKSLQSYGLGHLAPTLDMVLAETKRLEKYFFFVLFSVLPISTCEVERGFDMDKLITHEHEAAHDPKIYLGKFKREVEDELLHWAQEGFI